jgi:hypothetical protein
MFSEKDLLINIPESDLIKGAKGLFIKKIMIVSAPVPNTDFISKVLMAAQVNFENDTRMLELPMQSSLSLISNLPNPVPEKILVFGCTPHQLGLNILPSKYVVFDFSGIAWLFADTLEVIESDRSKKSQLWLSLKSMFDLP